MVLQMMVMKKVFEEIIVSNNVLSIHPKRMNFQSLTNNQLNIKNKETPNKTLVNRKKLAKMPTTRV